LDTESEPERIAALVHPAPLAPLRELPFVSCWISGALSSSANWMLSLSVPFLVYELTNSTTWLGIAAVASNAPSIIASPMGGLWADRYSKRLLLLASIVVQIAIALALYVTSTSGQLTASRLILLAAAMGFASSTHLSAYQAFISEIVPIEQIAPAYRLSAIQFNLSRAVGPAVAGFVLAQWGPSMAFLVNAVGYLPLAGVLLFISSRPLPRSAARGVLAELSEGARVAWLDPRLRRALVTTTVTATFGMSIYPLIAGLAKDVFQVGEQGLGLMVSSIGAASVVTAIGVVWLGDALRRSPMVRIGLILYGIGLWIVASTAEFSVGVLGFAITGLAHVLVNVSVTTSVQIHVPSELRGRVTSLQLMSIIVSMPIGAQLGGLLAETIGLSAVVALYGTMLVAYSAWAQLRMDRLHDLD
jgi:predicted MFS family arabinose efflux permease